MPAFESYSIVVPSIEAKSILAAAVDFQGKGHIIQLDLASRRATQLPRLGIFTNDNVSPNTVAVSSANGSSILFASIDGTTMLYDSNAGTFTAGRKDFKALAGAYAASNFGTFVVGSNVLNSSLVPMSQLETASGAASGFVFVDNAGFRTTSSGVANPGIIRNRLKVKSAVTNARALLKVREEFSTFDRYIWKFVEGKPLPRARRRHAIAVSELMSKSLRKRGFKFVGATICYAFMQAVGMVNDHDPRCFRHNRAAA